MDGNEAPYSFPYNIETLPLNRYVNEVEQRLVESIAQLNKVEPGQIVLGNGSSFLLDIAIGELCHLGVAAMDPTYRQYRHLAHRRRVPYWDIPVKDDMRMDVEGFIGCRSPIDLQIICNPNNPTGLCESMETLERIAHVGERFTLIDEAYIEFAGIAEYSAMALVNSSNRVGIVRTLSKAYGAASLRFGYIVCASELAQRLRAFCSLEPTSSVQQQIALQIIENQALCNRRVKEINAERCWLIRAMRQMNLLVWDSQASFILFSPPEGLAAGELYARLLDRGVVVRSMADQARIKDMLRVTIGSKEDNSQFLELLRLVLPSTHTPNN